MHRTRRLNRLDGESATQKLTWISSKRCDTMVTLRNRSFRTRSLQFNPAQQLFHNEQRATFRRFVILKMMFWKTRSILLEWKLSNLFLILM